MTRLALLLILGVAACSADRVRIQSPPIPTSSSAVATRPQALVTPTAEADPPTRLEPTFTVGAIAANLSATIDGDLSEWTGAPSLTFQAPGGSVTELWLSPSNQGILVAARGETQSLKLELSLPPMTFPPIGFANQFGEEVVAEETCSSLMPDGTARADADACRAWFASALIRHEELRRWFTRIVHVEGDKVLVQGDASDATLRRGNGTVELALPARAFPSSDMASIQSLTVRLWVGNARADIGPVGFDRALVFGDPPNLLEAVVVGGGDRDQLRFFQPGPKVDHVAVAYNRPVGYQFEPTEPSPFIGRISLERRRLLLKVKGRELLELPRDFGIPGEIPGYAWKNADGSLTLLRNISTWGDPAVAAVARRAGVDLLFASEQSQNPLGTGACGACSIGVMRVARITGDEVEQIVEEYVEPGTGDAVKVSVDRRGSKLSSSFECTGEIPTTIDVVFDPKTETYARRHNGAPGACAY